MKESKAKLAAAVGQVRGVNVNQESAIHGHVMRPPHLLGASSDPGRKDAPIIHNLPPKPGVEYGLDVPGFISAMQSALTNIDRRLLATSEPKRGGDDRHGQLGLGATTSGWRRKLDARCADVAMPAARRAGTPSTSAR
jgi:hypothetical protein